MIGSELRGRTAVLQLQRRYGGALLGNRLSHFAARKTGTGHPPQLLQDIAQYQLDDGHFGRAIDWNLPLEPQNAREKALVSPPSSALLPSSQSPGMCRCHDQR